MKKYVINFILGVLLLWGNQTFAKREMSQALPLTLEAIKIVLHPELENRRPGLFNKENRLGQMVTLLKNQKINPEYLGKILQKWEHLEKSSDETRFLLRDDNEGDELIRANHLRSLGPISFEKSTDEALTMPRMALHAYEFEMIDENNDFLKDDIYFYFYTTDGAVTTGRVTEIYKGISQGQSFFLTAKDRVLFPTKDIGYATPYKHLIIDYSIIESDGDDIRDMQKLSRAMIPLATAAYGLYTGDMATVLTSAASVTLRKEVGKLSDSLIALNNDNRLVNESLLYTPKKLLNTFADEDIIEFTKSYGGRTSWHYWKYKLNFRMFKD
jgi:hypothetical protein